MLKKIITYEDFNGRQVNEAFYFNMSSSELMEMETSEDGSLSDLLTAVSERGVPGELLSAFKDIILKAYGEKSEDGKRFNKSEALSHEFTQTAAYDALFMELTTNAELSSEFFQGIVPKDIGESIGSGTPPTPGFRPGHEPEERPIAPPMPEVSAPIREDPDYIAWKANRDARNLAAEQHREEAE